MTSNEVSKVRHRLSLIVAGVVVLAVLLSAAVKVLAASVVYYEGFDDDFYSGRNVPDGVDAGRSSDFGPIDACRRSWPDPGRLVIRSIDISSDMCPQASKTSSCGPALDFTDGGGTHVTFHYTSPFIIESGSYVEFQVTCFGSDYGELFKYVSTNGSDWTQVGTDACTMGNYRMPLPPGGNDAYFWLQVGDENGQYDGVIVDNFRAVLYDAQLAPAQVQEGDGCFCKFDEGGSWQGCVPIVSGWRVVLLALILASIGGVALRRRAGSLVQ